MRTLYRRARVPQVSGPPADALLVEDARVAWLGTGDEPPADHVVDLDGGLVLPGFVDAHAHLLETGLALGSLDLSGARSLEDALDLVAAAEPTGVTVGYGWDETRWPQGRPPSRAELDRAARGRAVYLARVDLASAVVSSPMADRADCVDAPGWHEDGRVAGEAARRARSAVVPADEAGRDALRRRALATAAAVGVVSVHEQSSPANETREELAALLARTATPASGLPGVVGYRAELCETVDDARALLVEVPGLTGIGGDLAMDGSLGSRTAALREPYADDVGRGDLTLTAEQVANHAAAVTRAGVQAAFHVTGDRAMDEVLLGFQAAAEVEGIDRIRAAGHRLEHAEMVDARALARILLLGLTVSVQPAFDAAWGGAEGMYARRLGLLRSAAVHPLADLVAAGVPVAFGSGSPITPVDPWAAVRAAVLHREPSQRLSVEEAFRSATGAGWAAAGVRGPAWLEVGGPASFAVWDVSDLTRPPVEEGAGPWLARLAQPGVRPRCLCTVREGTVIHDALG